MTATELMDWMFPEACGSTDPYFMQCELDYGHAGVHKYTIEPPEEYWEDDIPDEVTK